MTHRHPAVFPVLHAVRRPVSGAVLIAFILSPYGALAGAVPDLGAPAQNQPSVQTVGSVPVVDIVAPDAQGLSHNKWQQFDVPTAGMVLNNATGVTTSTLAGTLGANPNLAGSAASTILNEVTSSNPSSLLGTLEVAGQSARVIIANPNGIACDGCGFINTPHVQLTTGRPEVEAAALSFSVEGGHISLGSAGLPALAARLDLIARSIRSIGPIHSLDDVNMVSGRFKADADTLARHGIELPNDSSNVDYAIDIGQSVAANRIQLIAEGDYIGVRSAHSLAAVGDIILATRQNILLEGSVHAGRDLELFNVGAWNSSIAATVEAQRDVRIAAMVLSVQNGGSISAQRDVDLGFCPDNSDGWTSFENLGRIEAQGDIRIGGAGDGVNGGVISAAGDLDMLPVAFTPAPVNANLPGASYVYWAGPGELGGGASVFQNAGMLAAGQNLYVSLASNPGGEIQAGQDAFVWERWRPSLAQGAQLQPGSVSATRDLFLFAPDDFNEFSGAGDQTFIAGENLYLLAEVDRFSPRETLRARLLSDPMPAGSSASRYVNRDVLAAGQDILIYLPNVFENRKTIQAGRDLRVSASEFTNTADVRTTEEVTRYTGPRLCIDGVSTNCIHPVHAEPSPEPYPGCKTNYRGECTAQIDHLAATATMAVGRDVIIDAEVVHNWGASITAGRDIDIATNDFANNHRDYGVDWQAQWSDKPLLLDLNGTPCTSNCLAEIPVDWSRSASGHVHLGTEPANIQAGGTFSVDIFPRSGQGTSVAPSVPEPGAPIEQTPLTEGSQRPAGAALLAQALVSGAASVPEQRGPASRFINTGNINAVDISVTATEIRNGFDTVRDYYRRTAEASQPPAVIKVAGYGTSGMGPLASGTYSGSTLMQILPQGVASLAPFALTPEEELAAIRNAFLATTGRAWIFPGLVWDPETGQSPEQQQQAILAANGAAFAIEHGIAYGTELSLAQRAALPAPVLWYSQSDGKLTPVIYLPQAWQQELINLPGGKLEGEVAITLSAGHINNTGFILTDGLLAIDAAQLENQKRNAYYYEKREVKGGTLKISGDTVQSGGFMQAAMWDFNADSVYSRSGEFIVSGSSAEETAALSAAFEAQIRAELGDAFTYEVAKDNLKYKFEADDNGMGIIAMVAAVALSFVVGPMIATALNGAIGAGVASTALTSFTTGTLSSAVGQSIATGRVDWGGAFESGAISGFTAGLTNAPLFDGKSLNSLGGIGTVPGTNVSAVSGNTVEWTDRMLSYGGRALVNAGVSSAISGTSFEDAFKNSLVSDLNAYAANTIGTAYIGQEGSLGHYLSHGVLAAMAEAARGGDPTAAAIGAMTSVLVAPLAEGMTDLTGTKRQAFITAMSMLAGGYAAEALGHDGQAGAGAAQNAVVNNYLKHSDVEKLAASLKDCEAADTACQGLRALFDMASADNQRRIQNCYAQRTCAQIYADILQGVVALAEAHDVLGDEYYRYYLAQAEADLGLVIQTAQGPSDGERLAGQAMLGAAAVGAAALALPEVAAATLAVVRSCASNWLLCGNQAAILGGEFAAGDALPVGLGVGMAGILEKQLATKATSPAQLAEKLATFTSDELIEINGVLLFKAGNANRAEAVNGYLELTRNASAPYMPGTTVRDVVMQPGETVYIIENQFAQNPGGWATQRIYTDLNEARRELALLPEYKNLYKEETSEFLGDLVIREYSVKQPLPSRQGVAGPQTSPDGGLSYPGGGKQVEFLIDTRQYTIDAKTGVPVWKGYLVEQQEYRIGDAQLQPYPVSRENQP
jgi:filamentous hemagglutinin family protein